ncbi:MAG TPA: tRNA (adenosine(37)-N6)-dimethylallyltransferase MiaA, partial [Candidatus Peribacteraceae bacterium]|nr:tRNA (adenosine(37)-N6)-dimethylallyltransferase MiaA [Candidatus Peribacteraceae bacterium]
QKISHEMWRQLVTDFLTRSPRPLITILGQTASGKTGLSIEIAQAIGPRAEIINADSRQLYRYLDIGTAKITEAEMQGIPHHLLDVKDPKEEVTVGWYQREARALIDRLHSEGKVPLLVGGSMLYLSSIIDDLSLAPAGDLKLRKRLESEYDLDAGLSLYKRLQEIDPETAAGIPVQNKPYVVRAVEIFELTQQPKSKAVPLVELRQSKPQDDHLILGLKWPRPVIHEQINLRTKHMMERGWIDEVQGLLDRGYGPQDPGLKSHGYREIVRYLVGRLPMTIPELTEQIAAKTRQYARRQDTWWKGDKRINWLST